MGTLNTKQGSSELRRKGHDRRWQAVGSSSVVQAAQAQKVVATSNKLQLRAFAPSARATSYNRYIVYRRYLLLPPCALAYTVYIYVKQRVTEGPEIYSVKLIHISVVMKM